MYELNNGEMIEFNESNFSEEQMDILHEIMISGVGPYDDNEEGLKYIDEKIKNLQDYLIRNPDFECGKAQGAVLLLQDVSMEISRNMEMRESAEKSKDFAESHNLSVSNGKGLVPLIANYFEW